MRQGILRHSHQAPPKERRFASVADLQAAIDGFPEDSYTQFKSLEPRAGLKNHRRHQEWGIKGLDPTR